MLAGAGTGCDPEPGHSVLEFEDLSIPKVVEPAAGDGGSGCQGSACTAVLFDPSSDKPFPLSIDMPADPNEQDDGVGRDGQGFLVLDRTKSSSFHYAWTANTYDWRTGSVSKFDTKTLREVARYFTVTCQSLPTGSRSACNGSSGCCAQDSYPQFQNRQKGLASGPAQQVEIYINYPSRTAIDLDGSMWVANRAFGIQSSVTKIAGDVSQCIDRNHNGKIETSSDVDGDGIIESDCNQDVLPDDLPSVAASPCKNGKAQEFYGFDDECILLTTNTGEPDGYGRPLALGPGSTSTGASDVWAGLFQTSQVFRIDGKTGLTKAEVNLPCRPYGFVIDSTGIGWAANLGAGGCYWDTQTPANTGTIRESTESQTSYGIGIDRDLNIWFGGTAARYTPNRTGSFQNLGRGYWTVFSGISGLGVAVDDRGKNGYFAYFAGSKLFQVPASTIAVPVGADTTVSAVGFNSVPVLGSSGKGVDITNDGNVIVTFSGSAGIERVKVSASGSMSMPDLNSLPIGTNKCPSGDTCINEDHGPMSPYTYSDFTGFALRNFTRPKGYWRYLVKGCGDNKGGNTVWRSLTFEADTPPKTALSVRVRSGNTPTPDSSWGSWSADQTTSPVDLTTTLIPNTMKDGWMQLEVNLSTLDSDSTPRLRKLGLNYDCFDGPG